MASAIPADKLLWVSNSAPAGAASAIGRPAMARQWRIDRMVFPPLKKNDPLAFGVRFVLEPYHIYPFRVEEAVR